MGEDLELRRRAEDDERSTLARIESLQAQLVAEQRHLAEVRLFQSMLNGYAGGVTPLRAPREAEAAPPAPAEPSGDAETEAGLSAAQAEELERLNRLFGLSAGN